MIAGRLANMKSGSRTDLEPRPKSAQVAEVSTVRAAEQLRVGKSSVKDAKTVLASNDHELIRQVESGKMSVSSARSTVF